MVDTSVRCPDTRSFTLSWPRVLPDLRAATEDCNEKGNTHPKLCEFQRSVSCSFVRHLLKARKCLTDCDGTEAAEERNIEQSRKSRKTVACVEKRFLRHRRPCNIYEFNMFSASSSEHQINTDGTTQTKTMPQKQIAEHSKEASKSLLGEGGKGQKLNISDHSKEASTRLLGEKGGEHPQKKRITGHTDEDRCFMDECRD